MTKYRKTIGTIVFGFGLSIVVFGASLFASGYIKEEEVD